MKEFTCGSCNDKIIELQEELERYKKVSNERFWKMHRELSEKALPSLDYLILLNQYHELKHQIEQLEK